MNSYLKILARYLMDKYGEKISDLGLIFPNRRSGLFFRHFLSEVSSKNIWLPEIFTINSFFEELSGLNYADPLDLNFYIYDAYCKHRQAPEPYDEFYYWGEIMIGDFNDLDKYLVDAGDLFQNLSDLKELDNIFDYLTEEQIEVIRNFWKHFEGKELSNEQDTFLDIWKILPSVYKDFKDTLFNNDEGYEGMVYREVAEKIKSGKFPSLEKEKYIICGFNALSKAEEVLFNHLRKSGNADFFWDYDQSYVKSGSAEAGRFLRKNLKQFPHPDDFDFDPDTLERAKNIKIYDIPSDILQAKSLYKILSERDFQKESGAFSFEDTAVVLGDENLLIPVLSSLPSDLPGVNITMGYPLRNTPVYSFVESLLELQRNLAVRREKKDEKFYFRDVVRILNHQYLRSVHDEMVVKKLREITRNNLIYVPLDFFTDDILLQNIFQRVTEAAGMSDYINSVFEAIIDRVVSEMTDIPENLLEKEYIFQIRTRLNKLKKIIESRPEHISMDVYTRLFKKVLEDHRIPFEGEPLQGVQIMGILESRLLDFRNLIFLSMNEGVMPKTQVSNSFIPYNLRRAFSMPVKEDKDAIYAYYFYRIIQRAENVEIMYNSNTEGMKTGEPARYIYQLRFLYDFNIHMESLAFSIFEKQAVPIVIEKTREVMEKLNRFEENGDKKLSPSAISNYNDCSLRFYFSYIAGIREEDEVKEDLDAAGFGSLLHKTMEKLYTPWKGKELNAELISTIRKEENIENALKEAFSESFTGSSKRKKVVTPEGRNLIVYEVIKTLVRNVLDRDRDFTPLTIRDLELQVSGEILLPRSGKKVRLGGVIDRIDERKEGTAIIDYKTGKEELTPSSPDQLFNREEWKGKKYKGALQTLIYSWMYEKSYGSKKALKPGIYVLPGMKNKDFEPWVSFKEMNFQDFKKFSPEFEKRFLVLLEEIFDPAVSFSQTTDQKRCNYCPYADICHREQTEY